MKLQTEDRARVFGVSPAHSYENTPDRSITQHRSQRPSAKAERLFRCRLKAIVPEA
jgi:hypothetical protein